jgi:hypothetical protein
MVTAENAEDRRESRLQCSRMGRALTAENAILTAENAEDRRESTWVSDGWVGELTAENAEDRRESTWVSEVLEVPVELQHGFEVVGFWSGG